MKLIANYDRLVTDERGNITLSFTVTGEERRKARECASELIKLKEQGKDKLTVEVKQFRKQRSLNANAYFHLLVSKIAKVLDIGEDECKKQMVLEYGTIERDLEDNPFGIKIPKSADINSIYPYAKWFDTRLESGKEFDCYIIYKRTHTLDTKEMARLIDGVIFEAEQLGIETVTPEEKAKMLSLWEV